MSFCSDIPIYFFSVYVGFVYLKHTLAASIFVFFFRSLDYILLLSNLMVQMNIMLARLLEIFRK